MGVIITFVLGIFAGVIVEAMYITSTTINTIVASICIIALFGFVSFKIQQALDKKRNLRNRF